MHTSLEEVVEYTLPLYDVLDKHEYIDLNTFIGSTIRLSYEGYINCVVSGKKINKAYGEGMSYEAFMNSPEASPSIIRPELSRIHEGIALRDYEWEMEHHMQPHVVYLSLTNDIKVGVTRVTQIPTRWIDQGATQAILLAETPYRQAAGLIEVALKNYVPDKTNWQRMLKNEVNTQRNLTDVKKELHEKIPSELLAFYSKDDAILHINYPVESYPLKVSSIKLDKVPFVEKRLTGIKGQYLIFENGDVLNVRAHTGYRISIEV